MNERLAAFLKLVALALLVSALTVVAFAGGFVSGMVVLQQRTAAGAGGTPVRVEVTVTPGEAPTSSPVEGTRPPSSEETPSAPAEPSPTPLVSSPTPSSREETFRVFWEVWEILQKDFYGELPDEREMTYAAIRGMLETLNDPYTSFLEPEIAAIEREDASGTFEGIGAMVRMNEQGFLEIVWPFEGQPADKAGLRPGDVIVAVDGQSIEGYSVYEAITLIRGPEGTDVVLTIQREGVEEPFDVVVTRARIDIPLVRSTMLEGGIAYVSLFDFSSHAEEQLEETLQDLLAQNPKGLIFDLRGNPGGFLQEAVDVADLFLDEGVVLIERDAHGGENVYRSGPKGIAQEIPLVVLVNGGSASAAEIVAGAIQDRGRGVLIGQKTFGKGSVQLPRTLSDGSELRVTIARWFTPNGRAIHGQGLEPNIKVGAGLMKARDFLQKALTLLEEGDREGAGRELQKALEVVEGSAKEEVEGLIADLDTGSLSDLKARLERLLAEADAGGGMGDLANLDKDPVVQRAVQYLLTGE